MTQTKKQTLWILYLTVKYWLQGDTWKFAKEYAKGIVRGFKCTNKKGASMKGMELKKHIQRHKELHQAFDELLTAFINHTKKLSSKTTLYELIEWSHSQTLNPDPDKEG